MRSRVGALLGLCALFLLTVLVCWGSFALVPRIGDPAPEAGCGCGFDVVGGVSESCVTAAFDRGGFTLVRYSDPHIWIGQSPALGTQFDVQIQTTGSHVSRKYEVTVGVWPNGISAEEFEAQEARVRNAVWTLASELARSCSDGGAPLTCSSHYVKGKKHFRWSGDAGFSSR